jgi:hypothetical protein
MKLPRFLLNLDFVKGNLTLPDLRNVQIAAALRKGCRGTSQYDQWNQKPRHFITPTSNFFTHRGIQKSCNRS